MANRFRGEAELKFTREVDGVEREATFKLVYDANALCEIEDANGMGMMEMADAMSNPKKMSVKLIRAILYGGLTRHHPQPNLAEGLRFAGDIISDAGIEVVQVALTKAFSGAYKSAEGKAPRGKKAKS